MAKSWLQIRGGFFLNRITSLSAITKSYTFLWRSNNDAEFLYTFCSVLPKSSAPVKTWTADPGSQMDPTGRSQLASHQRSADFFSFLLALYNLMCPVRWIMEMFVGEKKVFSSLFSSTKSTFTWLDDEKSQSEWVFLILDLKSNFCLQFNLRGNKHISLPLHAVLCTVL